MDNNEGRLHNSRRSIPPSVGEQRRAPAPIQIPGAAIMAKGLKAEYTVQRYQEKQAKHPLDLGVDLFIMRDDELPKAEILSPSWSVFNLRTAFHAAIIPPVTMGLIHSRSSSLKTLRGGEVMSGIIDPHYTGEIIVIVRCLTDDIGVVADAIHHAAHEEVAIAQIVFCQMVAPMFAQWDDKAAGQLTRGIRGFGSTDMPKNPPIGS